MNVWVRRVASCGNAMWEDTQVDTNEMVHLVIRDDRGELFHIFRRPGGGLLVRSVERLLFAPETANALAVFAGRGMSVFGVPG